MVPICFAYNRRIFFFQSDHQFLQNISSSEFILWSVSSAVSCGQAYNRRLTGIPLVSCGVELESSLPVQYFEVEAQVEILLSFSHTVVISPTRASDNATC